MRLNEDTPPKLVKAIRAYFSGEIGAADMAATYRETSKADTAAAYRELADEEEARAAAIMPDTKESAYAKGEAIGMARGWRACAAVMERRAAEIDIAA